MKKELNRFTVFLDMDGVVVDWYNGFEQLFKDDLSEDEKRTLRAYFRKHQFVEDCPIRPREFWEEWKNRSNINNGFWWITLKPLPWAKQLYEELYDCGFVEEVAFLTSPGKDYTLCWEQKREWLKHYIGTDNIVITPYKYHCAKPSAILIDDTQKHIDQFAEHGGHAFRWPNQEKMLNFQEDDMPICQWAGRMESVCDIEDNLAGRLIESVKFDIMCRIGILNPPDDERKKKIRELHEKAGHVEGHVE